MYLLKLCLNIVVLFAISILLFYIYVRTWNKKASSFFKRCAFILITLYVLGLHYISYIFINIVVLNVVATYSFVKYGKFFAQYRGQSADDVVAH